MSSLFPSRPPRIELFQTIRPLFFLTFNTRGRANILANEAIHSVFLEFCRRAHDGYAVAVGRYVLMPDHIHLFVAIPESGIRLTRWVQALKSVLGKTLHEHGFSHPYWQEGFFDHVLRSSESYGQKWEYVRQNPVRAGLCKHPDDWLWKGEIVPIEF